MLTATHLAHPALCQPAARALRWVAVATLAWNISRVATAAAAPPTQPVPPPAANAAPAVPGEVKPPSAPLTADPPEYEPPPSEPPEYEPPPSEWPPPRPPPAVGPRPPGPSTGPLAPSAPAPRVSFELGLAGSALLNRGVYGFGGGLELGTRWRLPFGALGVALRVGLEQHIQPEPAPFLMNLGVAITYRLSRPRWRVSPYVGVWAQGMLQRTPDALGAIALQRNEGGLTLGGLAGAELRLGRGGIFTELGYRHTVYRQTRAVIPAWNAAQLLLGYRFTTN